MSGICTPVQVCGLGFFSVIPVFVQEALLLLTVFGLSLLWSNRGDHRRCRAMQRLARGAKAVAPTLGLASPPSGCPEHSAAHPADAALSLLFAGINAEPGASTTPKPTAAAEWRALSSAPKGVIGASAAAISAEIEERLLRSLGARNFTTALNQYRALERVGLARGFGERLYAQFIISAAKVGKPDVVNHFFSAMRQKGMAPSTQFWTATMKMLSSRKLFASCMAAYSTFGPEMVCDRVVCSCLINAALEVGEPELAGRVAEEFRSMWPLTTKDRLAVMRVYIALGRLDDAEGECRSLGGDVHPQLLNCLLAAMTSSAQVDRAIVLLEVAESFGQPFPDGAGEGVASYGAVNAGSYGVVMMGCAANGDLPRSFSLLQRMAERGVEPDDYTLRALLQAAFAEKYADTDMEAAARLAELLADACDDETLVAMSARLLRLIIRAGELPKALVNQRKLDLVSGLLDDMHSAGRRLDDIVATHVLEGCCHSQDKALGERIWKELVDVAGTPSPIALVVMLKLLGRCGRHEQAHDLVAGWEAAHGIAPSVVHYTCLMSGSLRSKQHDSAWRAYELMRQAGIRPDGTTLATLLPGMVVARCWERTATLLEEALVLGRDGAPEECIHHALAQWKAAGGDSAVHSDLAARWRQVSRAQDCCWRRP
eukprot:CAMPEP_0176062936 /NCGR_PEP_ID=MMETSP0120_2-20121206/31386_1 /TAXON_ID=160619 /ORGANISM="Kryptoperidinium foliaceum, Strain CCMP 1326" /LENGTH=655 /DNA_ID=CAMNT_0017396505 /DNA_START=126 /DNA_END=2093 /DNA_ORIENTATION=-